MAGFGQPLRPHHQLSGDEFQVFFGGLNAGWSPDGAVQPFGLDGGFDGREGWQVLLLDEADFLAGEGLHLIQYFVDWWYQVKAGARSIVYLDSQIMAYVSSSVATGRLSRR